MPSRRTGPLPRSAHVTCFLAASLFAAGCDRAPREPRIEALPDTVLAEVAGRRLTATEATELLAANPRVRGDSAEVRILAALWSSYTALAVGAAEDTATAGIDLESVVGPAREEALVLKLREAVIPSPTPLPAAELRELWDREGPTVELRTTQLDLDVPPGASPTIRDSVRRVAQSIVRRVRAGERFEALARQHSPTDLTAQRGGDTAFAPRGTIEPPALDSAAVSLEPGQVSDVIESPRGFHIVQLIARRARPPFSAFDLGKFGRVRGRKAVMAAEGRYLDSLVLATGAEVQPGMREAVRAIALDPADSLDARGSTVLVRYRGGTITAEEFRRYLLLQPPERRRAFAIASTEQLTTALKQLVWKELLLAEAARRGLALSPAEEQALRDQTRSAIDSATRAFRAADGARLPADSAAARVMSMLRETMARTRTMPPLGQIGAAIHQRYPARVNERAIGAVLDGLARARRTDTGAATRGA